jgi:hypothetical protein
MRLGLFMMPLHPPTRTLSAYLEETTEKALLAERLGFDEVWVGEHFSATSEPIPSPLMFMAGLVPQTKRITFATGVINLPNRHPARVCMKQRPFLLRSPQGGKTPPRRQKQVSKNLELSVAQSSSSNSQMTVAHQSLHVSLKVY